VNTIKNPTVKQTIKRRTQEYQAKSDIVDKFTSLIDRYFFVVFATEWNTECRTQLPCLAKLFIAASNPAHFHLDPVYNLFSAQLGVAYHF
jgi:hypothetical protein